MSYLNQLRRSLVRNMIWWILLFSILAFYQPQYFAPLTQYTSIFIGVAMLGMGATIPLSSFTEILRHPREIFLGMLAQYTIMPLLAISLIYILQLPPALAIGMVVLGCCPGGTASNVMTHIAKGDVVLSVSMTLVSTLLAPLFTPLLIYFLLGAWIEISLLALCKSLLWMIVLPLGIGLTLPIIFRSYRPFLEKWMPMISALSIIFIIAGIIALNKSYIVQAGFYAFIAVILHNTGGLLCGKWLAKFFHLSIPKETSLALEVGMQNSGLAMSLTILHFATYPLAALPGALFSVWHNISGAIFGAIQRKRLA